MERLDKVISSQTNYSRKDVKELIKQKKVMVNNNTVFKSDLKVDELCDEIIVNNERLSIKRNIYLILNKPKGYVSATKDNYDKTVLDFVPLEFKKRNIFPAGRLDKDTTGMMILTDDGVFAHDILAPKKHIKKIYKVTIDKEITDEMIKGFLDGVMLNDGMCKTAKLEKIDKNIGIVTLTEGRYHQIKRMFACFKANVIELERIGMGDMTLPEDLQLGEIRELTDEELKKINVKKN